MLCEILIHNAMKTICKLSFLFFALAWTACKKDKTPEEPNPAEEWGITIVDGMIESPEWLIHKTDSIAALYKLTPEGEKNYPLVYGVKYYGQELICVRDLYTACYVCGKLYFTLWGDSIDPKSSLWVELNGTGYSKEYHTLLWPLKFKSIMNESGYTKVKMP